MSVLLRDRWSRRLEELQADSSWRAQIERRVLRFLLSRYQEPIPEVPLTEFPLYQGQLPHGRGHVPLSHQQLRGRLNHIAQVGHERPHSPLSHAEESLEADFYQALGRKESLGAALDELIEWAAWRAMRGRRKKAAFAEFGQKPPSALQNASDWLQQDARTVLARIVRSRRL